MKSDISGHVRLALENGAPTSYLATSQNTNRAAFLTVSPGVTQMNVALVCNMVGLCGRVLDETGKPVPIAGVQLRITDAEGHTYDSFPLLTSIEGYFECDSFPAADGYTLQARAVVPEGEAPLEWNPPVALSWKSYYVEIPDLKIPQAAAEKAAHNKLFFEIGGCYRDLLTKGNGMDRYGGVVKNPQGQPVPGAFVELTYSLSAVGMYVKGAVTDAAGRWSRLLPTGLADLNISIKHENYVGTFGRRDFLRPTVESMRAGTAEITIEPGVHVAGVVRDEAGTPVADALVYHKLNSFTAGGPEPTAAWPIEDMTSTRTGADGSFAVSGVPPGSQELNVRKPGFAALVVPIEAAPGNPPLNIVLKKGGTIRGRILNEDGEPLAGAGLFCRQEANLSGTTDDQGFFMLENVPTGKRISISFTAKGYYGSTIREVRARDEPYELVLYRPLVFGGKVVDGTTGRPITKFEVSECWQTDERDQLDWVKTSSTDHVSSPAGEFTREFDGVSVQFPDNTQFAVSVTAKGYFPGISPLVRLGDKMQPFVISLQPGESVSGIVAQPEGQPAAGAQVLCTEKTRRYIVQRGQLWLPMVHDSRRFQETGADGAFDLPGNPEPMGLLALHETGYALFTQGQYVNGSTITLTPWASASGTVYRQGAPEAGVLVLAQSEGGTADNPVEWEPERTGADGKFVFTHLPALPLEVGRGLWLTGKLDISHGVHIHPSPGEGVAVDISAGGCTVEGQLDFELPETLAAVVDKFNLFRVVAVSQEEQATTCVASVEADGQFRIYDVPPGAYDLAAGLYAPPPEGEYSEWSLVAGGELAFEVPAAAASNEVLELGTIALQPKE